MPPLGRAPLGRAARWHHGHLAMAGAAAGRAQARATTATAARLCSARPRRRPRCYRRACGPTTTYLEKEGDEGATRGATRAARAARRRLRGAQVGCVPTFTCGLEAGQDGIWKQQRGRALASRRSPQRGWHREGPRSHHEGVGWVLWAAAAAHSGPGTTLGAGGRGPDGAPPPAGCGHHGVLSGRRMAIPS